VNELLVLRFCKICFSHCDLSPRSLVFSRTLLTVPDDDDGACSAGGSTLMLEWHEDNQDECLDPMFFTAPLVAVGIN